MENYEILDQFKNYTGNITITRFSDPRVIGISFQGANTTGFFNTAQGKYCEQKLIEKKTSLFQKFINKFKTIKL